jgi:hypothetical protein
MSKPADQLASLLPKAAASSGAGGSAVARLRDLLTQLDELRDQRDGMEGDYESLKVGYLTRRDVTHVAQLMLDM